MKRLEIEQALEARLRKKLAKKHNFVSNDPAGNVTHVTVSSTGMDETKESPSVSSISISSADSSSSLSANISEGPLSETTSKLIYELNS